MTVVLFCCLSVWQNWTIGPTYIRTDEKTPPEAFRGRFFVVGNRSGTLIAGNEWQASRAGVDRLGTDDQALGHLLDHVRGSSGRPANREDRGEDLRRDSDRVQDEGGVELDIRP